MTDDRAREEAERLYPGALTAAAIMRETFQDGAAWQAAQPVVVSDEQVEVALPCLDHNRTRCERNSALLEAARLTGAGSAYVLGYLLSAIPSTELERALSSVAEQPTDWGYMRPEPTP